MPYPATWTIGLTLAEVSVESGVADAVALLEVASAVVAAVREAGHLWKEK